MMKSDALFEILDRLAATRPLRPESAGPIVGVQFTPDEAASNVAKAVFVGTRSDNELFKSATMQRPANDVWGKAGFLELEIDDGVSVSQSDIRGKLGPEDRIIVPSPREPADSPMAIRYHRPWAVLSFGFVPGEDTLLFVTIDEAESDT